ncbi:hypothetical protein [Maricaulis sp.]|uniref:hypothetical protein n=1 Tax=Maricaulis sp. TaxID=1486257 RepID=UPI002635841D|nr:hypothetical protein [Maricaulis sp.]
MKLGYTASVHKDGEKITLRIEEWPEGFYVFFLRGDATVSYRDELQDTLDIAMLVGEEDFGITKDQWVLEEWPRWLR